MKWIYEKLFFINIYESKYIAITKTLLLKKNNYYYYINIVIIIIKYI